MSSKDIPWYKDIYIRTHEDLNREKKQSTSESKAHDSYVLPDESIHAILKTSPAITPALRAYQHPDLYRHDANSAFLYVLTDRRKGSMNVRRRSRARGDSVVSSGESVVSA